MNDPLSQLDNASVQLQQENTDWLNWFAAVALIVIGATCTGIFIWGTLSRGVPLIVAIGLGSLMTIAGIYAAYSILNTD